MNRRGFWPIALVGLCIAVPSFAADNSLPPLPKTGFVSGRAAQVEDFKRGDAVFVLASPNGVVGKPLAIEIPQYAYWKDKKEVVVVVQAEETKGVKFYGARERSGQPVALADGDIELLGTHPDRR